MSTPHVRTRTHANGKPLLDSPVAVRAAMLHKLEESTLTSADARALRLTPLTAVQCAPLQLTVNRAGFKIPYFDLKGQPTEFYRYRYLEYHDGRGFSAVVHGNGNGDGPLKHDLRYTQPENKPPELYLSPTINWEAAARDVALPLVFTEGELKAACGCKHGLRTIGLGGVWNWRSANRHWPVLPALKQFKWENRVVHICFDSDGATNPHVCQAENALAHELLNMGADVCIDRLPTLPGMTKTGLDDYIREMSAESFVKDVMEEADRYMASAELYRLNAEVVYVQDPGIILRLDTLQRLTPWAFVDHAFANRIWHRTVTAGKTQKLVECSAPKEWLRWPMRSTVVKQTYAPGQPAMVNGMYNTWAGWGVEPAKGDLGPWNELLKFLFKDADDQKAELQWFRQWLAYPLQNPGTKLRQAVLLWSIRQQVGKSVLGYTMGCIYGKNFTEIGTKQLTGEFNDWAENKQFVMGDEITSSSERKKHVADRMKSMITQRELRLNPKFVPAYTVPDCINYFLTSNHPDALYLEDADARYYVLEVKGDPLPKTFYNDYVKWALHGPGAAAIFDSLLELPITTYDPNGLPPSTRSKHEMTGAGKNDMQAFIRKLRDEPETVMAIGDVAVPYDLWRLEELVALARDNHVTVLAQNSFANELKAAGFRRARGDAIEGVGPVDAKLQVRGKAHLWMMRNADMMVGWTAAQLREHYLKERGLPVQVKKAKY